MRRLPLPPHRDQRIAEEAGSANGIRFHSPHPQYLQQQDEAGETPLFCAIHKHAAKMVQSLIRCGSLLDVRDNAGNTPLMTSILEKQEPVALSFASLSRLGPNHLRVY